MGNSNTTASVSNAIPPRRRMIWGYPLIFVDASIDETNAYFQTTLAEVEAVLRKVVLCKTHKECTEAINALADKKVFVISSGALGQSVVSAIHDIACVEAIYIFYADEGTIKNEKWTKNWSKIRGVFTSMKSICNSIEEVAQQCDHDAMPMNFIPQYKTEKATSVEDHLKRLPSTFMYSLLFKEIMLEIDDDDKKITSRFR